jgi:hypothetical protein
MTPLDRARALAESRAAAPAAVVAMMAASVLARLWLARSVKTPWILVDEYIYSELAKSFAAGGHYLIRGAPAGLVSYVYPALIAPAWLAGSMHTTYLLAKTINAVVLTLVAVPVYLWGIRIAPRRYVLVAVALTLLIPSFFYTGELMTENAFATTFVLACFATALVLERPTLWRQALMLTAFALTIGVRFQGLVLLAVLPTAVLLKLCFDLLGRGSEPRLPVLRRNLFPLWPTAAVLLGGGVAYVAYKHAQGVPLRSGLGAYQGVTATGYPLSTAARWTLYHFAEMPLAAGYIPACALLLLLGLAFARARSMSAAERSFLAVAAASVVWIVLEVATFASRYSLRVEERYMFPVAPILLLALAVWFGRGMPRPMILTAVAAAVPALLLVFLPLTTLLNVSLISDTFGLIPFYRLSQLLSGGIPVAKKILLLGGVGGSLLFALVPRRFGMPAIVAAIATFLVLSSYSVHGTIRDYSRDIAANTGVLSDPTWIDDRTGDSDVGVLYGNASDLFTEAVALWENEFWNRDLEQVYTFGNPEPVAFAETLVRLDEKNGRISTAPAAGAAAQRELERTHVFVTDSGTDLIGVPAVSHGPFDLYDRRAAPRIASLTAGIFTDGWMGADASYRRFDATRPGSVSVSLSRASWGGPDVPGNVSVTISPAGRGPASKELTIHRRQSRVVVLRTPPRPFAVAIHIDPTFSPSQFGQADTRQLGAQVSLSYRPRS